MLSWLCMSLIHTLIKINKDRWPESVNGHILFRFGPKIFHVFCSLFNYSSANALALVWRNGNCPRCHLSQLLQCFTSVSQSPWQTSTSFIIMYTGWEVYRLNLKRNYFGKVDLASTDLVPTNVHFNWILVEDHQTSWESSWVYLFFNMRVCFRHFCETSNGNFEFSYHYFHFSQSLTL